MTDMTKFFDTVRDGKLLGPTLSQSEVDGCNVIIGAFAGSPLAYCAYALATAYRETWHTMQPIEEKGGTAYFFRMYDPQGNRPTIAAQLGNTRPGDGAAFHGRGYVQLTGRTNYAKAGARLGIDLVNHPELALVTKTAAAIMLQGMLAGWFTGKKLSDYLPTVGPATVTDFTQARRIINGQDDAAEIADWAVQFQAALS